MENSRKEFNRDASRAVLQGFVGKKVTEVFYDGDELVMEFDKMLRLQLSPRGLYVDKRRDVPEERFPIEFQESGLSS
jgi:hypothetical protein